MTGQREAADVNNSASKGGILEWLWPPHYDQAITGSVFEYWGCAPVSTLVTRILFAIYFVVWFALGFERNLTGEYFAFLTIWGFIISGGYAIASVVLSSYQLQGDKDAGGRPLRRWTCVLFEIALPFEAVITILFWTLLWLPRYLDGDENFDYDFAVTVQLHGGGLLLLVIEFVLNRIPFFNRHLLVSLIVGCLYIPVNAAVTLIRDDPIYDIIDWMTPLSAVFALGSLAGLAIFHYFFMCLRRHAMSSDKPAEVPAGHGV
ncbi:unnamed protein product [Vitrella brassicaformis CCMP3155]|uniref:Uncharacterized protein n=2 Tax=Vitrella brassicaformis TaxID=1169539 RepID=A0A0G4H204_VITBC|nr:unnamed protein product [Vitrella brassicaformis CCMP3155]|mmetsp:Transcript_2100/g.4751  ORF Transcript_2100/g.4751 Transcript_2100/m.4751 type:complete len:261 (+) Transcript_2100:159-941(+)|eukprot:CEM37663.1 unnamed protein product [Vitrella brassicaformis CCMP3155]